MDIVWSKQEREEIEDAEGREKRYTKSRLLRNRVVQSENDSQRVQHLERYLKFEHHHTKNISHKNGLISAISVIEQSK